MAEEENKITRASFQYGLLHPPLTRIPATNLDARHVFQGIPEGTPGGTPGAPTSNDTSVEARADADQRMPTRNMEESRDTTRGPKHSN